jgi:hypothetical protein
MEEGMDAKNSQDCPFVFFLHFSRNLYPIVNMTLQICKMFYFQNVL